MTEREKTYGRITISAALLAAVISVGTLVWNMSDTSARAHAAYEYTSKYQDMPTKLGFHADRIKALDARVCTLEQLATSVAVLNTNISSLSTQLNRVEADIRAARSQRETGQR